MKKGYTLLSLLATLSFSCTKDEATANAANCLQDPPAWCATVRCSPDGKPVCGCNKVTYGSACEAECAGVASFTYGSCKN